MVKSVAIYARVSTSSQDCENQLIELRRYVKARNWEFKEYIDQGIGGGEDESKRPALKSMLTDARYKKIDAVIVWDFSRFARSMRQLINALDNFKEWGISFISLREGVDTTTANGRLMYGIFASLAEFEKELIRERVMLGLNRARKAGKRLGRPTVSVDRKALLRLKSEGLSTRAIGRKLGISKTLVSNLLANNPL